MQPKTVNASETFNVTTDGKSTDIYLYNPIGFFMDEGQKFAESLKAITTKEVTVHINSGGGNVFDGMAILVALNELKKRATITTIVEGIGASMAGVLALAGDKRAMYQGSYLMYHEPWLIMAGNRYDLQKEVAVLEMISKDHVAFIADKTGKDPQAVADMLQAETWLNAEQALAEGFIDEVIQVTEKVAFADTSYFKNAPASLLIEKEDNSQDEVAESATYEKEITPIATLEVEQAKASARLRLLDKKRGFLNDDDDLIR